MYDKYIAHISIWNNTTATTTMQPQRYLRARDTVLTSIVLATPARKHEERRLALVASVINRRLFQDTATSAVLAAQLETKRNSSVK